MKTMLIVDDEPAIARMIQRVAEGCGYSATVTTRSDEFMDQVVAIEPSVIVMDLSIPAADGVELIRFLAATRCRAKILVISGVDPRVLETTGALGSALGLLIAGTISKPVRLAELRAAIEGL
ncbi:MAG TPA: response regulator [Sphingomicrobium sp.]|nr:response regulator [Sphingomicrobium sp.]